MVFSPFIATADVRPSGTEQRPNELSKVKEEKARLAHTGYAGAKKSNKIFFQHIDIQILKRHQPVKNLT